MDKEKIISIVLSFFGIFLIFDSLLARFFNIGIENHLYSLPYCIAFILSGFYYPEIVKKKVVIYPLYILIAITITSLISAYL